MIPFDFLICSERSGSNLITKIMDAHPDVCGPFPSHILSYFSRNLYRYGDLASEESWSCLLEGRLPEEDLSSRLSATERQVHASFGVARKRIEERSLYRRGW